MEMGIHVKMITGDQLAIAKETCRILSIGQNVIPGELFRNKDAAAAAGSEKTRGQLIEEADGFAQVYPEDKYEIVKYLKKKHIVGMTGDGVNDTAALKKADIGIAVAGATDAARNAADIVLKTPGLTVIINAILGSRKIFKRMTTYCVYSISMAVRVVLLFTILTVAYNWYFSTVAMVILAVLNDGCMIAISRDRAIPNPFPDRWSGKIVFSTAIAYGVWLTISSLALFEVAYNTDWFPNTFGLVSLYQGNNKPMLVGLIYLQVSVGGLATIFICRTRSFFFLTRPGLAVIIAYVVAQIIASIIAAFGLPTQFEQFGGCGGGYVLVAWIWSIIWFIPMDLIKVLFYFCTAHLQWTSSSTLSRTRRPISPEIRLSREQVRQSLSASVRK